MPHLDRLRELVYVSPSGKEYRPLWDTLERSGGKKAAIHELPQADVADVQDLGDQAEHFPLALYFVGSDYDQAADAFYAALRERGRGLLKHPRWGDIDVLPTSWSQAEDLVGSLRAARFQVEFIHAPDISTLTAQTTTAAAIQSASDIAAGAASASTAAQMVAKDAAAVARLKSQITKRVKATAAKLKSMSAGIDEIRRSVEAQARAIDRGIDTLLGTPLELANSVIALSRTPSRMDGSIGSKVSGYAELLADSVGAVLGLAGAALAGAAADIYGLVVGLSESVTVGTLASRTDAVLAHDTLSEAISGAETAIEYLESQGYVPDPVLLAYIADLKARASAFLLESSYDLPGERTITLDAASSPLVLAHELLADADRAEEIITLNGWGGDMLLVLPIGTEVRYYA